MALTSSSNSARIPVCEDTLVPPPRRLLPRSLVYSFGYPFPVYPNTECSGSELYPNIRVTRYVVNIRVPPIYSGPLPPNIRSDTECQIWSYGFSPSIFGSVHGTVYVLSYVRTGTLCIPAGLLLSSLSLVLCALIYIWTCGSVMAFIFSFS